MHPLLTLFALQHNAAGCQSQLSDTPNTAGKVGRIGWRTYMRASLPVWQHLLQCMFTLHSESVLAGGRDRYGDVRNGVRLAG